LEDTEKIDHTMLCPNKFLFSSGETRDFVTTVVSAAPYPCAARQQTLLMMALVGCVNFIKHKSTNIHESAEKFSAEIKKCLGAG
jgi:hypothetical protein